MLFPTHLATGHLLLKGICLVEKTSCSQENPLNLLIMIGAIFPDIDAFFVKRVNKHRNTFMHAPLFWICFVLFSTLVGFQKYALAFGIGIFSHLFLDWLSGRTIGIRLLYPFSKKSYSLFPLHPEVGNIGFIPNKKNWSDYKRWLRFLFKNPFLVICEFIILISSLVVFVLNR